MHENPNVHEKTTFFVWPSWMSEIGYKAHRQKMLHSPGLKSGWNCTISVEADIFLGVQRDFPEKTFVQQISVAVGSLRYIFLYQVAIDLKIEDLALEIWFLITPAEKTGLSRAVQEHFQKSAGSVDYSWASATQFWSLALHSHSSCCCQQGSSHVGEVGLKFFGLWRHVCGMYHIIYIMTVSWISQHCLFNFTYMQQTVSQNGFIYTL